MKRFGIYFVLGLVFLFIESTLLTGWPTQNIRLQLVWICILYLGFRGPLRQNSLLALLLGLIADALGTPFLGPLATVYFLTVVLLRVFTAQMFVETLWARLSWVGILSIAATLFRWGLLVIAGRSDIVQSFSLSYSTLQAFINMATAALLFPVFEKLDQWIKSTNYES